MTLKQYFFIMIIGTVLCWVAWWMVVLNIDPNQDQGVGFAFFYISLFLALLGTLSVVSFVFRRFFSRADLPVYRYVQRSFHDAIFYSILLVALLYLQGIGYLRWWNGLILIIGLFLYFIFVWSTKNKNQIPN